jgi:lipid-A-disaccharide synthase
LRILVSTLEPSGNLHLESLLSEFSDEVKIGGIFDEKFGKPIVSSREFGVMGIFSILPKIKLAKESLKQMVEIAEHFEKVLLIDSPAFNLRLAKKLKEKYPEKEIIYYILPKVWAWKSGRKKQIDKYVDYPIAIFPFEKNIFKKALYFGNPLLEQISYFREEPIKNGIISFLAGSRKSEIKNLMPTFRELAKEFSSEKRLVVPPHLDLEIYGDISNFKIYRNSEEALKDSAFAYICSGTATLESAIMGVPFALVFKTSSLEYSIGRKFVKLKYVGLANIIFDKLGICGEFHSEHLQNLNVKKLANEFRNNNPKKFISNSKILRKLLNGNPSKEIRRIIFGKS